MLKWFIRLNENKEIISLFKTNDINYQKSSNEIEITDNLKAINLVRENKLEALEVINQKLKKKKVIILVPDRTELKSDGKDEINIKFEGDTEGLELINLIVAGKELEVPINEPLTITSNKEGFFVVKVNDKKLYSRQLNLRVYDHEI